MKAAAFGVTPEQYRLVIRTYGKNGVMAGWETETKIRTHELGFVVEVVGRTQEIANAVLAIARTSMLHVDFPGRLCKEGNMAFPFRRSDIETGPPYRFCVFHTVALKIRARFSPSNTRLCEDPWREFVTSPRLQEQERGPVRADHRRGVRRPALYHKVKATGVLNAALFARLYGVAEFDVLFTPYDTAAAFKATLPRPISAGDFGDTDVYGAQQHAPLLDVDIPLS